MSHDIAHRFNNFWHFNIQLYRRNSPNSVVTVSASLKEINIARKEDVLPGCFVSNNTSAPGDAYSDTDDKQANAPTVRFCDIFPSYL